MIKSCRDCSQEFETKAPAKSCQLCRGARPKAMPMKEAKCLRAARSLANRTKSCPACHKTVVTMRHDRVGFCSEDCRLLHFSYTHTKKPARKERQQVSRA